MMGQLAGDVVYLIGRTTVMTASRQSPGELVYLIGQWKQDSQVIILQV